MSNIEVVNHNTYEGLKSLKLIQFLLMAHKLGFEAVEEIIMAIGRSILNEYRFDKMEPI